MDNPVSGFIMILPMVIPTVPFCIPDSIATVTDCLLFILNKFELLYPIISIEKINSAFHNFTKKNKCFLIALSQNQIEI